MGGYGPNAIPTQHQPAAPPIRDVCAGGLCGFASAAFAVPGLSLFGMGLSAVLAVIAVIRPVHVTARG